MNYSNGINEKILVNTTEIDKLEQMLTESNIPFDKQYIHNGICLIYPGAEELRRAWLEEYGLLYDTKVNDKGCVCGVNVFTKGKEQGLLEITGLMTDEELKQGKHVNCLSADNVFKRIEKHYKENGGK